jgi:hypothetical protein
MQMNLTKTAGTLAFDLLRNGFHQPLIDGKANRDKIEDEITTGILSGNLPYYVDQEIVDLAIDAINDLIKQYGAGDASVAERT